jgi:hypothetical protein
MTQKWRDSKYAFTNAPGVLISITAYCIGSDPVGAFHSEKEFSESLRLNLLPDLIHRTEYKVVFTHTYLNMKNILVKDGRVSEIVDWENARWFPEYWKYTNYHFGVRL